MPESPDTASTPEPCPSVTPLHYPEGGVPQRSRLEKALFWLPVLGWIAAHEMEKRRLYPTLESIFLQFEQRPAIPVGVWGDSDERQAMGSLFAALIEEERRFPQNRIIPDDPMELLFFAEDLDFIAVIDELEGELGLPAQSLEFTQEECDELSPLTVGQFLTVLMDRIERVRERHSDFAKRGGTPVE